MPSWCVRARLWGGVVRGLGREVVQIKISWVGMVVGGVMILGTVGERQRDRGVGRMKWRRKDSRKGGESGFWGGWLVSLELTGEKKADGQTRWMDGLTWVRSQLPGERFDRAVGLMDDDAMNVGWGGCSG